MTRAVCPASLSFVFKLCPNRNLLRMGSIGIGCTVNEIVTCQVAFNPSGLRISFNGKIVRFPTVESVIKLLTNAHNFSIDFSSKLPAGFGFGISGASALSSAFALTKLLQLKKDKSELAQIAHVAEIKNRTGLGNVATQITGGFLLKTAPGLPVTAYQLPFVGKKLYATIIGALPTPSILQNKSMVEKINKAADRALSQLASKRKTSLSFILDTAYSFAQEAGLINDARVVSLIKGIKADGGHATQAMLGKVAISDRKPQVNKYQVVELAVSKTYAH